MCLQNMRGNPRGADAGVTQAGSPPLSTGPHTASKSIAALHSSEGRVLPQGRNLCGGASTFGETAERAQQQHTEDAPSQRTPIPVRAAIASHH
jgi:hypothetical protein